MKLQVKIDQKTYEVHIEDIHARPVTVRIEGQQFEVWPQETATAPSQTIVNPLPAVSQPAPAAPAALSAAASPNQVKAPIPGVIIEISAKPGDAVSYGQELCVLEAMKMKNSIRSSRDGIIDQVFISVGEQVNQNQVLVSFREKES